MCPGLIRVFFNKREIHSSLRAPLSVNQLQALSEILEFNTKELFVDPDSAKKTISKSYKIAVGGTGYVGLSLAVLLSQHNTVTAVAIISEKVDKLNNYISPIQDEYIGSF